MPHLGYPIHQNFRQIRSRLGYSAHTLWQTARTARDRDLWIFTSTCHTQITRADISTDRVAQAWSHPAFPAWKPRSGSLCVSISRLPLVGPVKYALRNRCQNTSFVKHAGPIQSLPSTNHTEATRTHTQATRSANSNETTQVWLQLAYPIRHLGEPGSLGVISLDRAQYRSREDYPVWHNQPTRFKKIETGAPEPELDLKVLVTFRLPGLLYLELGNRGVTDKLLIFMQTWK